MPLEITVTAGERGPVMVLAGETDLATTPELCRELTALLATGARHMTVDVSALTFADSTSIQALMLAGLTLQRRGGALALLIALLTVSTQSLKAATSNPVKNLREP